jgi:hypothetical protein
MADSADDMLPGMRGDVRGAGGAPAPPSLPFAASDDLGLLDVESLSESLWDPADDPTLLSGPSAIASLGTRARAVAYTRPLHDLESSKGRLGGEAWAALNLVELGFHAIDVVALRMDFDSGARHDDVIAALAALALHQHPGLQDAWRVGERVLEGLITGRSGTDADSHQAVYGSWGPDGYVAKRFDYALLTEHVDAEGEFYLRATDPAISVLMGALDLDVESAQIASELRLNELVKRGLLTAAIHEAQRAKYRSIQYTNQLQRQISHAQMHTTERGALTAVDRLVEHALEHVIDRYHAERAIIGNVADTRDNADDPLARRRANQLIAELEQCELRHQHLQRRLIRARSEFREAHAEQLAVGPAPPSRVDLERQVLRPVLRSTLVAADHLARLVFRIASSPEPPTLVDPEQLVGALCALPPAVDELGDEADPDAELVDARDQRRFDDETWDAIDELLGGLDAPSSLAELVGRVQVEATAAGLPVDVADARAHLLALRAVHGFDPALADHARQLDLPGAEPEAAVLWWRPKGQRFATDTLSGDDLAVFPAWVTADPDELPPDPFTTEDVHHAR